MCYGRRCRIASVWHSGRLLVRKQPGNFQWRATFPRWEAAALLYKLWRPRSHEGLTCVFRSWPYSHYAWRDPTWHSSAVCRLKRPGWLVPPTVLQGNVLLLTPFFLNGPSILLWGSKSSLSFLERKKKECQKERTRFAFLLVQYPVPGSAARIKKPGLSCSRRPW